jgi:hypothetical protein
LADNAKFVRLRCTIEWANLTKRGEMSNKFEFDMTQLDPAAVKALKSIGLEPKINTDKQERGYVLSVRSARPMKAFAPDGEEMDASIIGNGSEAIAIIGAYDWQFKKQKGRSATLRKLTITDLKEYTPVDADIDEADIVDTADL